MVFPAGPFSRNTTPTACAATGPSPVSGTMKAIFARLAILLALLVSGAALAREGGAPAQDHIVGRAVLEDPEGTLSIEDVTGRAFAPAGPILARGYTPSTHWLRLTVRPGDGGPLVLRIRPTYLDRVELYEPDANAPGGWKRDVTGDRTPFWNATFPPSRSASPSGRPGRRRPITCACRRPAPRCCMPRHCCRRSPRLPICRSMSTRSSFSGCCSASCCGRRATFWPAAIRWSAASPSTSCSSSATTC
ncbi:7TM-DISM domain-containing protein [Ancylobacter dichloromethanicus]